MPEDAIIAVSYQDQDGRHAGFVTIHLPEKGDPGDAGRELLNRGAGDDTWSRLRREGFRGHPPEAHPHMNYKEVMRRAQERKITHIYRAGGTSWGYQNSDFMYRDGPFNQDNIDGIAEQYAIRVSRTPSPHTILPPEAAPSQTPDTLVPDLNMDHCREAARFLPRFGPPAHRAARLVDLAATVTLNTLADQGLHLDYEHGPLTTNREALIEHAEQSLGNSGKGWNNSGPESPVNVYAQVYTACRQILLDYLSGPDADSVFPQAFVDRYNLNAAAREGAV